MFHVVVPVSLVYLLCVLHFADALRLAIVYLTFVKEAFGDQTSHPEHSIILPVTLVIATIIEVKSSFTVPLSTEIVTEINPFFVFERTLLFELESAWRHGFERLEDRLDLGG